MSFQKIKSGIPCLDERFQGVYLGRPTLISGKRRSGTSTHVLRYIAQLLRIGEKVLLFTEGSPDHVALEAHGIGADITEAIGTEQLVIVPYDRQLPLLPFPEALEELREMIVDRYCNFVVFDPVIPWLAADSQRLSGRIEAFFDLLEETAATTLLVLRHPVSRLARRLFDEVSERCAICIIAAQPVAGSRTLEVVKYMGAPPEDCPTVLQCVPAVPGATSSYSDNPDGMSLRELHSSTQRIPSSMPSQFPFENHPPAPAKHHAADRLPGEPAIAPLPLALPHAPELHDKPLSHAAPPAPPAAPQAEPVRAPRAPEAESAPSVSSPFSFHSRENPHAASSATAPRQTEAPRSPAPPRNGIRFSDALSDDAPPREATHSPARAPSAPEPGTPAPQHTIRFSDIIQ